MCVFIHTYITKGGNDVHDDGVGISVGVVRAVGSIARRREHGAWINNICASHISYDKK